MLIICIICKKKVNRNRKTYIFNNNFYLVGGVIGGAIGGGIGDCIGGDARVGSVGSGVSGGSGVPVSVML